MPTVTFDQLGLWLVCGLIFLDVALRLAAHFREKKTAEAGSNVTLQPSPLTVRAHQEYATREAQAKIEKELEKLDNERRVSVAKLHDKQEAMGQRMARVEEKTDGQTKQLFAIQNSLENMPQKIASFVNTIKK